MPFCSALTGICLSAGMMRAARQFMIRHDHDECVDHEFMINGYLFGELDDVLKIQFVQTIT